MKRILIISLFAIILFPTFACGPFDRGYLASQYFTFRLFGDNMSGSFNQITEIRQRQENCKKWAETTSISLPLRDIEQVVYNWSPAQIDSLLINKESHDNAFAEWIINHRDVEIVKFLTLAKRCEQTRSAQNTRWYYHVDGNMESMCLKKIVKKAQTYKGQRLRDRYLLQIIRAHFADQQYDLCVDLWEHSSGYFHDDIIRDLALNYIIGAYQHLGQNHKADSIKPEIENEELKKLCEFQRKIHDCEHWEYAQEEYHNLYETVCSMINKRQYRDKARWYYTKAFLADKIGNGKEALSCIRIAQSFTADINLKASIRVLDCFLNTKYQKSYNSAFENYLYNELLWLDRKITAGLTSEIKNRIQEHGIDSQICGWSLYYWNDMLRKIVIGNVVPLCIKSNYKTRTLQYLNMADNLIFTKCQNVVLTDFQLDGSTTSKTLTWNEYRNSHCNKYDYRNDYFINLDSLGVKYVKSLARRMSEPLSPLDHFLNNNCYTDPQFLYDIIGTQLMASGKYAEAVKYLRNVSNQFYRGRNISNYFNRDPFEIGRRTTEPLGIGVKTDLLYKLHFAQKMSELERDIRKESNPNTKAEKMLVYTRGIQNSIGECWPLTSFYWGYWECYPFHSQHQKLNMNALSAKVRKLKAKAFAMFTDDERAAKAYQDWCMWKMAITKYPNTKTAESIRHHCDNLIDYRPRTNLSPGFEHHDCYAFR